MLINLKVALMELRMSQADFSQRIDITPTVLSEIIHEHRRAHESLRAKIASALNASESWLFSASARTPELRGSTENRFTPKHKFSNTPRLRS